ncbi:hypothetical protein SYJ56_14265 [Algoriphagus sp. D3-2-R+10]|uniref:hypothetical protein n=1 Tax=Algoriphagus aurantiacus TaxID=3103948 RepID=UPI002B38DB57|nr:hypothetical protein [Algoriphagus sp. D3-2-R+10]MEB2776483.1 hypothetical protein [Algoriphagus sp. D3-2-R+10]
MGEREKPWFHKKGIPVLSDSRFENWNKWSRMGYEREWFDFYEVDRFDDFHTNMIFIHEFYIDEKLLGFYLVWKLDNHLVGLKE